MAGTDDLSGDRGEIVVQADVSKLGWLLGVAAPPAAHPWLGGRPEPPHPPAAPRST